MWTPLIVSTFGEEKIKSFGSEAAIKRAGQPSELGPAYVFLASDDASFITAQVIRVNGSEVVWIILCSASNRISILVFLRKSGYMPSNQIVRCSQLMKTFGLTIAFAESATAGRLSAEFSLVPDCGEILKGGIVCYDACIKQDILGVPESLVKKYTPESAEVTAAMTKSLSKMVPADIYISVTGLTMPGGSETKEKPVGTMFVHALIKGKAVERRFRFSGLPESIVLQTIDCIAELLIDELSSVK